MTAGAEATIRQLTADDDDRIARTQSRPPVAWIWGGIAVIAVIIVAVMVWTLSITHVGFDSGLSVTVPDVTNQSWENGSAVLISKKLLPVRVDETSPTILEGTILRTSPKPGTGVRPQETIQVYVSSGPQKVNVPQLVGLSQTDAQAAIEAKGFKLGTVTTQHSPNVAKDKVMTSSPDSTSQAALGTAIDLVISDGIITIPSVVGKPVGEATSTLGGPAVRATVVTQADSGCSGGLVTSQSLVGDKPQNSTVTIIYCGAP